ncbi:hypothetical protein [Gordonia sp. CPCC 205333]|uniref:hypothetical protein n=1 Tax=Gordonia sp. CPCC 205333 TaxID=3140790 RepID=UPI003AF3F854
MPGMKPTASVTWRIAMSVVIAVSIVACAALVVHNIGWIPNDFWALGWLTVLMAAGGTWLATTIVGFSRYRRIAGWALIPAVIIVATGLFTVFDTPLRVALAASDDKLRSYETSCAPTTGRWIGAIHVVEANQFNGACHFYTSADFLDTSGFAKFSTPPPAPGASDSGVYIYTQFSGDWYTFIQEW